MYTNTSFITGTVVDIPFYNDPITKLKKSGQIICEYVAGSHLYNLNVATSDIDIKGVFQLPKSELISLKSKPEEIANASQDIKYYELNKFLSLATTGNPTVLDAFWVPKKFIKSTSAVYKFLVSNREVFLSQDCVNAHLGYAYQQLSKAKGKNKLVHNPQPEQPPTRECFCRVIPARKLLFGGYKLAFSGNEPPCRPIPLLRLNMNLQDYHAASLEGVSNAFRLYYYGEASKGVFRGDNLVCESIPLADEMTKFRGILIFSQNDYEYNLKKWKEYWEWVSNRNVTRWKLQEDGKLNYDQKNFLHLFRLIYSARNILENGEPIITFRGEVRKFLLSIRRGEFDYDYLYNIASEEINEIKILKEKSTLPKSVNKDQVDKLYKSCYNL